MSKEADKPMFLTSVTELLLTDQSGDRTIEVKIEIFQSRDGSLYHGISKREYFEMKLAFYDVPPVGNFIWVSVAPINLKQRSPSIDALICFVSKELETMFGESFSSLLNRDDLIRMIEVRRKWTVQGPN